MDHQEMPLSSDIQWMPIYGDYEMAKVYTTDVETGAISQVKKICNSIQSKNANIRLMPDIHPGIGCVIGYTSRINDYLMPGLIGIDIGCGVSATRIPFNITDKQDFFKQFDQAVRNLIPSGYERQNKAAFDSKELQQYYSQTTLSKEIKFVEFSRKLQLTCKKTDCQMTRSIGTLGGGNHFIELDENEQNGELWLLIHTGSRNIGGRIAGYHKERTQVYEYDYEALFQKIAKMEPIDIEVSVADEFREYVQKRFKEMNLPKQFEKTKKLYITHKKRDDLAWLTGPRRQDYIDDMKLAQAYAQINRLCIEHLLHTFINEYAENHKLEKLDYADKSLGDRIESVHNYIDFEKNIIRKGAISAQKDEKLIIPLNMRDGCVIGRGLGNEEWNFSAPHGAGRKMSRIDCKEKITMADYKKDMTGVWSSCVHNGTIDESPMAYKNVDTVLDFIQQSVDVAMRLRSVYNFKAGEEKCDDQ
ncbi:tRNA-splicing_ligase RtcB [Hexamita inflata]|uniref:3'-phosphate/5'-hydroxy nucleic acid ligase n=1 Tax=Hexamita inflata TaxID=28002 RepID=A0ABP1GK47_9EUKA